MSNGDRIRSYRGKRGVIVRVVTTETAEAIYTLILVRFDDGSEGMVHPYMIARDWQEAAE